MTKRMMADLEDAIEKVIERHAESGNSWQELIHQTLHIQMAQAAEAVFDAAQAAQTYAKAETP